MGKFFTKFTTYFLLITLGTNVGCYTFSRGDFIGYTEVPNSQTFKNYNYNYKITSRPTIFNPLLVLSFYKTPIYEYSSIENYNEIRTPSKGEDTFPKILLYGGFIAGLVGLAFIIDTTANNEKKQNGNILLGAGIARSTFGSYCYA